MMTEFASATRRPPGITPSQTVGPFFHSMLTPHDYDVPPVFSPDLTAGTGLTQSIRIAGRVFDADGAAVVDAMIEIWQADAKGDYATSEAVLEGNRRPFHGFGRCDTGKDGGFSFTTLKPGAVMGPDNKPQAPHLAVNVFGRGLLKHLTTRFYFAGEPDNAHDPVLALVPAKRRDTLMLKQDASGIWKLDIHLDGAQETVFFGV